MNITTQEKIDANSCKPLELPLDQFYWFFNHPIGLEMSLEMYDGWRKKEAELKAQQKNEELSEDDAKRLDRISTAIFNKKNDKCFFMGELIHYEGKVLKSLVKNRCALNLDLDHTGLAWNTLKELLDAMPFAYAVHTTFNHRPEDPRYRVIIPLAKLIETEQDFKIATYWIFETYFKGVDYDTASLRYAQKMYYPKRIKEAEYLWKVDKTRPLFDWTTIPEDEYEAIKKSYKVKKTTPKSGNTTRSNAAVFDPKAYNEAYAAEDPTQKPGIIGEINRTYTIPEAIEEYCTKDYVADRVDAGRYKFVESSSKGGLLLINDHVAFNHSTTDPIGWMDYGDQLPISAYDLILYHGAYKKGDQYVRFNGDRNALRKHWQLFDKNNPQRAENRRKLKPRY